MEKGIKLSKIVTTIRISKSLKDEAFKAAGEGRFPGASNFSSVVEVALHRLLHPKTRPVEDTKLEASVEVEA